MTTPVLSLSAFTLDSASLQTQLLQSPSEQQAPNQPLPLHIQHWLASLFHPLPIPPFEQDTTSTTVLTELHTLSLQQAELTQLLRDDKQSQLLALQQDNLYKSSLLASLSLLPQFHTHSLPTNSTSTRHTHSAATFVPSTSLESSLSALSSLAQHLSVHSADESVMLSALIDHKHNQQKRQYDNQILQYDISRLQHDIQSTSTAITAHQTLLHQLEYNNTKQQSLTQLTQHYTTELTNYNIKHKEYQHRLTTAQNKLKNNNNNNNNTLPTLSQLLSVQDDIRLLETRLQNITSEVSVWDGLSSDVRVARRQVMEAECEVVRLEEEIERRLSAMSAFD